MAFLPHWVRPVLVAGLVLLWMSLEVALRSLFGELVGAGPAQWTVPVWRLFEVQFPPQTRPADRLDLTRILGPGCLELPTDEPLPRLKRSGREVARRVWIARHWDEERIVDLWASLHRARARDLR